MKVKVTDQFLATHSGNPLVSIVQGQRKVIAETIQRAENAERRERDAAREIGNLKRTIVELRSGVEK